MTNWISLQIEPEAERAAGGRGQQGQGAQTSRRRTKRGTPADRQADGQDDGERFHPFDPGGQEQRAKMLANPSIELSER